MSMHIGYTYLPNNSPPSYPCPRFYHRSLSYSRCFDLGFGFDDDVVRQYYRLYFFFFFFVIGIWVPGTGVGLVAYAGFFADDAVRADCEGAVGGGELGAEMDVGVVANCEGVGTGGDCQGMKGGCWGDVGWGFGRFEGGHCLGWVRGV